MGILLFVRCIRYVITVTERVVCTRMRGEAEEEEEEAASLLSLSLSPPLVLPSFSRLAARGSKSVSRSQPSSLCHCESFRVRLRATDYRNQPVPVPVYRPANYNHRFERRHFLVFELIREDGCLLASSTRIYG